MSQQKYSFTNPGSVISSNEDGPQTETEDEKYSKRGWHKLANNNSLGLAGTSPKLCGC